MNSLELIAEELAQQISAEVLTKVRNEIALMMKRIKISYTEKEAAEILGMSIDSLAKIRKNNGIAYSQTISPPRGSEHGGRFVYLKHHLLDYLSRNEQRPVGKLKVSLHDVL